MILNAILGCLALLSLILLLWQWLVARRFPLHRRAEPGAFSPPLSVLKPLKGCDETTEACLRSWFEQDYNGDLQLLFGVASVDDPVCDVVRRLLAQFPQRSGKLKVCASLSGTNLKVSKLLNLEQEAKYDLLVISDADVKIPPDFLRNAVQPLEQDQVGLVNPFYRLANVGTAAMQWEAVAVNADFWSQVLQSRSLKPLDFALGAVMVTRRALIRDVGGFAALVNCLADDYQLGHRIAGLGHQIALCPIVVECWSAPMGWVEVWKHQLRWARTIRVCQPIPYFFSILSNATLWPWLWVAGAPSLVSLLLAVVSLLLRMLMANDLQHRLSISPPVATRFPVPIVKDLLQTAIWLLAFLGNNVEWRGELLQLRRDGTIARA